MSRKKLVVKLESKEYVEIEKQIIRVELEKSRLSREKGMIILNKSVFLYFVFMVTGVFGFMNHYITSWMLNFIIIMGLIALIVGTIPYVIAAHKEQKNLSRILNNLLLRIGDHDKEFKRRLG